MRGCRLVIYEDIDYVERTYLKLWFCLSKNKDLRFGNSEVLMDLISRYKRNPKAVQPIASDAFASRENPQSYIGVESVVSRSDRRPAYAGPYSVFSLFMSEGIKAYHYCPEEQVGSTSKGQRRLSELRWMGANLGPSGPFKG
jgi:hypothetical protein